MTAITVVEKKYMIRMPDYLLNAAKKKAQEQDMDLSQVVREYLRKWVKK